MLNFPHWVEGYNHRALTIAPGGHLDEYDRVPKLKEDRGNSAQFRNIFALRHLGFWYGPAATGLLRVVRCNETKELPP